MMGNLTNAWACPYFNPFSGLFTLLFLALTFWLIITLIRNHGFHLGNRAAKHDDVALLILRERYARGEINKTEYEEKKKDLLNL